MCGCNYREDQKNQKILVGYGLISRNQCVIHHYPYFLATHTGAYRYIACASVKSQTWTFCVALCSTKMKCMDLTWQL